MANMTCDGNEHGCPQACARGHLPPLEMLWSAFCAANVVYSLSR